ncbi:hypothetical protein HOY80DRAFT_577930 [Tuber brumale]|nr:hypothetical protein HOY80DRAFT_577930 [Tuber brumale]
MHMRHMRGNTRIGELNNPPLIRFIQQWIRMPCGRARYLLLAPPFLVLITIFIRITKHHSTKTYFPSHASRRYCAGSGRTDDSGLMLAPQSTALARALLRSKSTTSVPVYVFSFPQLLGGRWKRLVDSGVVGWWYLFTSNYSTFSNDTSNRCCS